ncbi:MAG TPA: SPFH domain-containing protein [Candidatus Omnitrophota bacterium]|nr:SPFH domain-containing protein [Candidatus Omnitrophota bacterium]HPS37361.1 SPFH domain-containing protein [Candidatus Omnitrophota bacterium]
MLNIGFFKGEPGQYVIKFVNGKIRKEGQGLLFFYWRPTTTITVIPTTTRDANFIFSEITQTFQGITIQGQLTYRISDPQKTSTILDFSIQPTSKKYLSDDPEKLQKRIINAVQLVTRGKIQGYSLENCLRKSEEIAKNVLSEIMKDKLLDSLGVECLSIYFTSIKPTPEISKALEAEYREAVQKKADEAIYSRRAAAVEQERIIKENELSSEIAIEKNRQELINLNGNNRTKEAEYAAKALTIGLDPYKQYDPKLLLALGLKALGENAEKIGQLTITPELLAGLLEPKQSK